MGELEKFRGQVTNEASLLRVFSDLGVLGRIASLPTVISNCIAGWVLSGGGNLGKLFLLCIGMSFLQIAISWLTVLVDVKNEGEYQRMYPWLSTRLSLRAPWVLCVTFIGVGMLLSIACSQAIGLVACCIVLIGLCIACTHRVFFLAALLPGFLRAFYYIAGGCVAWGGLLGYSLWGAVGILFFMFGAGFVTRQKWNAELRSLFVPFVAFLVPLILALIINDGEYRSIGACFVGALAAWLAYVFYRQNIRLEMEQTAGYLTATICLVDFLGAGVESVPVALVLGGLFVITNLFCQNMKRLDNILIIL